MMQLPVEKDIVVKRIEGIEAEIVALRKLAAHPIGEFSSGDDWRLAQFHLHRALEGVFNISSHLLSRIPGAQATQYREIAMKMGEYGLVPKAFAETTLVSMAKYRNRLVHFYAEVAAEELYKILQDDLRDFETFLSSIKQVFVEPQKFGLTVS